MENTILNEGGYFEFVKKKITRQYVSLQIRDTRAYVICDGIEIEKMFFIKNKILVVEIISSSKD